MERRRRPFVALTPSPSLSTPPVSRCTSEKKTPSVRARNRIGYDSNWTERDAPILAGRETTPLRRACRMIRVVLLLRGYAR